MKRASLPSIALWGVIYVLLGQSTAAADVLPAGLARCADEKDDAVRLHCFDHEVSVLRAAGDSAVQERKAVRAGDPFPLRTEEPRKPVSSPSIRARLTAVSTLPGDRLSFQLDNGQVWVQNESRSGFPSAVGDPVTIKKGALGSIWLVTDKRWGTRVHRVR